jgi:hypothetical protein
LQWVGGVIAEERGEEDRNYCNLYLQKHKWVIAIGVRRVIAVGEGDHANRRATQSAIEEVAKVYIKYLLQTLSPNCAILG